jgi:hypothetical protein
MAVGANTGSEFFKTYLKQHAPDRPQEKELAGSDQAQYAHGPHDGGITFSITERQSSALPTSSKPAPYENLIHLSTDGLHETLCNRFHGLYRGCDVFTKVTFRGTEKFSKHRDSREHSHNKVVNMLALSEILAKRPEPRKVRFFHYHVSIACYFVEMVNSESAHPSQITWIMICTRKNQAKFELMSSSNPSIFSDPKLTRHRKSAHEISMSSLHHRLRYITLQCLKDSPSLQCSWFRYIGFVTSHRNASRIHHFYNAHGFVTFMQIHTCQSVQATCSC